MASPGAVLRTTWLRACAIGVLLSLLVALELVRGSPALVAEPWSALRVGGVVVCLYTFWVLVAATGLAAVSLALGRAGLPRVALVTPQLLWTAALLVAAHTALNEAARGLHALEPWKPLLRGGLAVAALAALLWSFRSARHGLRPTARVERALAGALLPALALAALYAATPWPEAAAARPGGVIGLAPRFEPEPEPLATAAPSPGRPRVLLVGLDGASWDRIEAGIAAGRLPTFGRLVRGGRTARLGSLVPTYSPRIWTSIATGVPAEAHGITHFYMTQLPRLGVERLGLRRSMDPLEEFLTATGELRRIPVTSSLRRSKALWNLADEAGLRAGVLGLWATWPPEPLEHGFVVSDHASLARRHEWLERRKTSTLTPGVTTWPPELEARLAPLQRAPSSVTREELGRFLPVDDALWREFQAIEGFSKDVKLSAFRSTHLNDAFFLGAARLLWEEDRPDLLFAYAKAIDELSHFFYEAGAPEAAALGWSADEIARYGGVVDRAYEWTDTELAPLVDAIDRDPDSLLIVVSDHGWEREPDGGYNHNFAPPGILILYGAGVCTGECPPLGQPGIYDLAPTVLERLRLPLSAELVGRPLVEAFRRPNPIRRVARYGGALGRSLAVASDIDPELNEKLRALGYAE